MINISPDKQLCNTNTAVDKNFTKNTKKTPKTNTQQTSHTAKSLNSIIDSIFKQAITKPDTNETILEILKNNPTLKNIKNISADIKNLLNLLSKQDTSQLLQTSNLKKVLNTLLLDPKHTDAKTLKQKLQNSGVFLESKLKNTQDTAENIKKMLLDDLKSALLKTKKEISTSSTQNKTEIIKHIDKLTMQIQYNQLLSHLLNSASTQLPFEGFKEANINIKKSKENKFYCDIELKLKDYGDILLKLAVYDKNQLDIHIYSENTKFQNIVKTNIKTLRLNLTNANIAPRNIKILKNTKTKPSQYNTEENIKMGFEAKA